MADRQGFEPWIPCGIHAFQACAFSHSAICPLVHPIPRQPFDFTTRDARSAVCQILHSCVSNPPNRANVDELLAPVARGRDGFIARTGSDIAMLEVCGDGWSPPDDRTAARLPFPYTEQPELERSCV